MRRGRADEVADELLGLVTTGVFSVGQPLPSEAELAGRFGVSRLTVREAIRLLSSTRVLHVRQGRPTVVNPADHWSPLDGRLLAARGLAGSDPLLLPRRLLEARRTVEVAIAELAAERRDDSHLARLSEIHAEMCAAHARADVEAATEADLAFHDLLFEAADNVFLAALFEPLSSVLRALRRQTSGVSEIREHALDRHAAILQAVVDGDPGRAGEAMRAHLVQTEEDTIHHFRSGLTVASQVG